MYKLDLPIDRREAAAIERRRTQEEQRKSRIFNAKTRQIGIDEQALEQQAKDRQQMELMEKRRDEAFAADAVRNDMIGQLLEKRQNHDTRELNKALDEFRMLHQQPDGRREFDLYDPDCLKKDKPARVSDEDPRCGIASLQRFEGEDLNSKARRQYQAEQTREWAEQQMREKQQANKNQKSADRLYELKMRELDQRGMDLADAEDQCRHAIDRATADYNKALQREQEAKDALKKQQDLDDNATEMANHIYGDFLTENPAVAKSAFGPNRVIPDRWKGMSPEQLEEIRRTQDLQRKEAMRKKEEDGRLDEEHARIAKAHARAGMLMEREKERREEAIRKQMASENRVLSSQQKAHVEYLDKEVYTNPPTAGYFMQFNTTTR